MQKLKDGRIIFSQLEVRNMSAVLEHAVTVVDIMEADKNLGEDYAEVRLFKALHSCADIGLTADSLTSKD
jgi:hypothetical protein